MRGAPTPDPDLARQRAVVEAFAAAAQRGDFAALMEVLDPGVVLRSDGGARAPQHTTLVQGPQAVAAQAHSFSALGASARPVLVNGAAGALVVTPDGPFALLGFTVSGGRIVEIDVLADPDRLRALGLS